MSTFPRKLRFRKTKKGGVELSLKKEDDDFDGMHADAYENKSDSSPVNKKTVQTGGSIAWNGFPVEDSRPPSETNPADMGVAWRLAMTICAMMGVRVDLFRVSSVVSLFGLLQCFSNWPRLTIKLTPFLLQFAVLYTIA